jgi:hypothetical protein
MSKNYIPCAYSYDNQDDVRDDFIMTEPELRGAL